MTADRQEIEMLRERFEGRPHDPEDWHGGIPESIANCPICSAHAALDVLARRLAAYEEALREITGYIEGEYREGDKPFQVAIVARAALAPPGQEAETG